MEPERAVVKGVNPAVFVAAVLLPVGFVFATVPSVGVVTTPATASTSPLSLDRH